MAAPPTGSLDVSEALIREVEAADVIVIGTPMYNFTIPSNLKAWIDQILRVGRTMKSTPGMLRDRPVFIGVTSGGVFTGDRANQPDFLTPYLSLAFSSIGLKTLQFLSVQATALLDQDQAPVARDDALATIDPTVVEDLRSVYGRPASDRASAPRRAGRAEGSPLSVEILAALGETGVARGASLMRPARPTAVS